MKEGQKNEDITNPRRCLFCQAIFSLRKCLFKVIISRNYIIMIEKNNLKKNIQYQQIQKLIKSLG